MDHRRPSSWPPLAARYAASGRLARRDRRAGPGHLGTGHFATGRSVYARALVWAAVEQSNVLVVPTTALAVAWSQIPTEAHPVLAVLLGLPNTVLEDLDGPIARHVGLLVAAAGHGGPVAGHVVWCGRQRQWAILTADPGPLRAIDPDIDIEQLP